MEMLDEAKDNDVLEEMLRWFSAQFMSEDKVVEEASANLRAFADPGIRSPKVYQAEYVVPLSLPLGALFGNQVSFHYVL